MESVVKKLRKVYSQLTSTRNTRNWTKTPWLKAHARYIDEIWCLYLSQIDKLKFQGNRGINFLLVTEKWSGSSGRGFHQSEFEEERAQFPSKLSLDQEK